MADREERKGLMGSLADAWRYVAGAGPGGLQGHLEPLAPLAQQPFTLEELAAVMAPLDYEIAVALQPQDGGKYSLARAFSQGRPDIVRHIGWGDYEMAHNHPGMGIEYGISPGDVRAWNYDNFPAAHLVAGGKYMSFDRDSIEQMLELMETGGKLLTAGKGEILGQ